MKIIFDDKSEVELNEDEQVVMSAMMACYAATAVKDVEGAVMSVILCEMRYSGVAQKVTRSIGEKIVVDAAKKAGYPKQDLEDGVKKCKKSGSDRVKELFG